MEKPGPREQAALVAVALQREEGKKVTVFEPSAREPTAVGTQAPWRASGPGQVGLCPLHGGIKGCTTTSCSQD